MKYVLKTISPLHIGNGESWSRFQYIVDRGKVYFLDFPHIKKAFDEKGRGNLLTLFLKKMAQGKSLSQFEREEGIDIESSLKDNSFYFIPIYGNKFPSSQISEFIKLEKRIYIPGSSVKGAIRTAILFCWWRERKDKFRQRMINLQRNIKEIKRSSIDRKIVRNKINQEISKAEYSITKVLSSEILSCIKVSDSTFQDVENSCFVAQVWRRPPVFFELVKENKEFNLEIDIDEKRLDLLKGSGKISEEQYNLVMNWKNCLSEFSKSLISAYRELYSKTRLNNIIVGDKAKPEMVDDFLTKLQSFEGKEDELLLRIGRGKGFLASTLWIALGDNEDSFHEFNGIFNTILRKNGFPPVTLMNVDGKFLGWCVLKRY